MNEKLHHLLFCIGGMPSGSTHSARAVFFADQKGTQTSTNLDFEEERKKQRDAEIEKNAQTFNAQIEDEKLKKQLGRFHDTARTILSSGSTLEKDLTIRLIEGQISKERYEVLLKAMKGDIGKNDEQREQAKELAQLEMEKKIEQDTFDLAIEVLESRDASDEEKDEIKKFLRKKTASAERSLKATLKLKRGKKGPTATHEVYGTVEPLVRQQDIQQLIRERMQTFHEYISQKIDTPEDRKTFLALNEQFRTLSQKKEPLENELRIILQEISRKDGKVEKGVQEKLEQSLAAITDHPIRLDEEKITQDQIRGALQKAQHETNWKFQLPQNAVAEMHARLAEIQKIDLEMFRINQEMKKMLNIREEEMNRRARAQLDIIAAEEATGISLIQPEEKAEKPIRIQYTDEKTGERKQAEVFVSVVPIGQKEEVEWQGQTFTQEDIPLVVVVGEETYTLGRFRKFVEKNDAVEVIHDQEELEEKIGFAAYNQQLRPGLELQWNEIRRDENGKEFYESKTAKIERILGDRIQLDRPVTVRTPEGSLHAGLEAPEEKSTFTYGEFAQWIRKWDVVPYLRTKEERAKAGIAENTIYIPDVAERLNFSDAVQTPSDSEMDIDPVVVSNLLRGVRKQGMHQFDASAEAQQSTKPLEGTPLHAEAIAAEEEKLRKRAEEFVKNGGGGGGESGGGGTGGDGHDGGPGDAGGGEGGHGIAHHEGAAGAPEHPHEGPEHGGAHDEHGHDEHDGDHEHDGGGHEDHDAHGDAHGAAHGGGAHAHPVKHEAPVHIPKSNYLKKLWSKTTVLTGQDIWELAKACYEYYVRWYQRNNKRRYSTYGKDLPKIDTEMLRIKEEAEHHEMGKFKEAMAHMGVKEIQHILHTTGNPDQTKACIEVLVEKGQMRWDDIDFWKTVNRFVPDEKKIRYQTGLHADPYGHVMTDPETGRSLTGLDMLPFALDYLWGDNQYNQWFNANISKYNSQMQTFSEKGDQFENDPKNNGGPGAHLQQMLKNHMEGKYTDPQEFEGFIRFIIDKGKSTVENKLYFITMGVASGLLSMDRIGSLDGIYLNRLPWLDFFTDKTTKKPFQDPDLPAHPYSWAELQSLASYLEGDPAKGKKEWYPGPRAKEFLWTHVLRHEKTMIRTNKGVRSGENIDHDDTQFIIPLLSEEMAVKATGSSGGRKNYFTLEGYMNAYSGYSEFMNTNAQQGDVARLMKCIRAWVKYDAVLDSRYKVVKYDDVAMRISESDMHRKSVVDDLSVIDHKVQMKNMILQIGDAYGKDFRKVFEKEYQPNTDTGQQHQKDIENAIDGFGKEFENMIVSDKGEKMIEIVKNTGLFGTGAVLTPEQEMLLKQQKESRAEKEELLSEFGKAEGGGGLD